MPDDPKAADLPRHTCWACSWDSFWPYAGRGCFVCLRERLKRGHAPPPPPPGEVDCATQDAGDE